MDVLGAALDHSAEKIALVAWLVRNVSFTRAVVRMCAAAADMAPGEENTLLLQASHDVFSAGMRHVPTIMAQMQQLKQNKGMHAVISPHDIRPSRYIRALSLAFGFPIINFE
jgi:hypothetical protein